MGVAVGSGLGTAELILLRSKLVIGSKWPYPPARRKHKETSVRSSYKAVREAGKMMKIVALGERQRRDRAAR